MQPALEETERHCRDANECRLFPSVLGVNPNMIPGRSRDESVLQLQCISLKLAMAMAT
jgi:hypothetical protein